MTKNRRKGESQISNGNGLKVRLDAIVLLLLNAHFADAEGRIKLKQAAPILHLAGYTPTEIATLIGKKKATEVAQYLYSKSPN